MSTGPEVADAPRPADAGPVETAADRSLRNPYYRYLMHLGLPLAVSLAAHVGVLVFLGLKTFNILTRAQIEVGEYEASLTESLADQMDRALNWAAADPLEAPEPDLADASFESLSALDVPAFDARELDAAEPGGGGEGGGLGIGDGALALLGTGGGAGAAGTGGLGGGLGGGGPRIGQAGVWDLSVRANRIAYVIDFSGSIIVVVDDLKRELKRSIGRLKPSQSFNVIIFYSSGPGKEERGQTESFRAQLEPADEQTRREFFAWIDRKAPQGETFPLQAMQRALALDPEVVFFFSDGYFEDRIVDEINRANNRARARIYCLVFDELYLSDASGLPPAEKEGARRLRRIAEANGGAVKIVTGRDLMR